MGLPEDAGSLDLRNFLGVLRRRKTLIVGIMGIITVLSALYINQITPLYRAKAIMVIGNNKQNVVNIDTVAQGLNTDYYTNETQAAIVASRALAEKAVDRLKLMENPLFNYHLRPAPPGLVKAVTRAVKSWARAAILDPLRQLLSQGAELETEGAPEESLSEEEQERLVREDVLDSYLDGLSAVPEERSHIIAVRYVSESPEMAAKAANMAATLYIEDQLESKGKATSKASSWLNERVEQLHQAVLESERKLEEYRQNSGIMDLGDTTTMYQQQLGDLSRQLVEARNARSEAQARVEQVTSLLEADGGIETAAAVLDSALIQRLREQEAQVVRKVSELETQYREGHPKMVLAKNELKDLREKITGEVSKIVVNQTNELEIAAVRERNLASEIKRLEGLINQQNDSKVSLRALESDVKANKQLYETFLERFKETGVQDETLLQADARVISQASVPSLPFYPRKNLMLLAALVFSGVLGTVLAFLFEYLDSGFRSLTQIEQMTSLPALGMLPLVADHGKKPHQIAIEKPNSSYGEAIRTLRTGLMLSNIDRPPRTVAVTSAVPGEGKSSTSLAIACATAKAGKRAIILDCDIRSPSLHENLGIPNNAGVSDYLSGNALLDDVIEIEPASGVHYVTAGARAPNPSDLLGSEAMRGLLATLERGYDTIILDMPPLLAVSDVLILVRVVDKMVFVVRWEKTPRQTSLSALRQLMDSGADVAGIVLTQVDVRRHAQYNYADSGYYQGGYAKYYVDDV